MNTSGSPKNGKRWIQHAGIIAALLTAVAFSAAGCADEKYPVARVATAPTGDSAAAGSATPTGGGNAIAFAQCMRRNGIDSFPDPASDGSLKFNSKSNIDPNSSDFKAAEAKCKEYMPTGEKNIQPGQDPWSTELKLQYAKCMRANGVPSFPDPDQDGRFPALEKGSALDPDSALFKKADTACAQYKPQNMGINSGPQGGSAR